MPRTSPYSITLAEAERTELEARARRYTSPYSDVVRAWIVLYAADSLGNDEIAARPDTPRWCPSGANASNSLRFLAAMHAPKGDIVEAGVRARIVLYAADGLRKPCSSSGMISTSVGAGHPKLACELPAKTTRR